MTSFQKEVNYLINPHNFAIDYFSPTNDYFTHSHLPVLLILIANNNIFATTKF